MKSQNISSLVSTTHKRRKSWKCDLTICEQTRSQIGWAFWPLAIIISQ